MPSVKSKHQILKLWQKADIAGESYFPYQFFYQLLQSGELNGQYEIDPKDSVDARGQ